MCNCAVPEPTPTRDALLRLRRLHRILAAGRSVDGWIGESALSDAIKEIERLRRFAADNLAWTAEDQKAVDADIWCDWTQENDEGSDVWATTCGKLFCLNEGSPTENKMRFCCYCGKTLREFLFEGDAA